MTVRSGRQRLREAVIHGSHGRVGAGATQAQTSGYSPIPSPSLPSPAPSPDIRSKLSRLSGKTGSITTVPGLRIRSVTLPSAPPNSAQTQVPIRRLDFHQVQLAMAPDTTSAWPAIVAE